MEGTRLSHAAPHADESGIRWLLRLWSAWDTGDDQGRAQAYHARHTPAQLARLAGFDPRPSRRLSRLGGVRKESAPDCRQRQWKELYGSRFDKARRGFAAGIISLRALWPTPAHPVHWKGREYTAVRLSWCIRRQSG